MGGRLRGGMGMIIELGSFLECLVVSVSGDEGGLRSTVVCVG